MGVEGDSMGGRGGGIGIEAYCVRHPAKRIEFFWDTPNLSSGRGDYLFCSTCILKGCIPCQASDLLDIEEFLLVQREVLESKGISELPDICKKIMRKPKKEHPLSHSSMGEINKLFQQINTFEERIAIVISNLRRSIDAELQSRDNNYIISMNSLHSSIQEAFLPSILSNYANFDQLLNSFQANHPEGLAELLSVLSSDQRNRQESQFEISKRVNSVETLENQVLEIKPEVLQNIEKSINELEKNIGFAMANLIGVQKIEEPAMQQTTITNRFDKSMISRDLNASIANTSYIMNQTVIQMQDKVLEEIKISDIRKIVCSANFVSGHTRQINSICTYGINKVATCGEDNTIRLWDLDQMECLDSLRGHTQGVRDIISLPNGFLVSASYDKTIRIWNTSPILVSTENNHSMHQSASQQLHQSTTTTSPQIIANSSVSQNQLVRILKGHHSGVICLLYLSGQLLASGSSDYTIKIWDINTGDALRTISGHTSEVLCLAQPFRISLPAKKYPEFSGDNQCLISGSSDKTIIVWQLSKRKNKVAQLRTLTGHKDYVYTLVMMPDDVTLVSGSHDHMIFLWNIHTGSILGRLEGHRSYITRISLYSERTVISSSTDGSLKFWDINIKNCVHTLEGHEGAVNNFAILPDHSIWSVGLDKNVHVWD